MTRREPMGGPLWYLGLWTPDGDPADLVARVVAAFRSVGATVKDGGAAPPGVLLRSARLPSSPPGGVSVDPLPATDGALVQVCLSGANVDGPDVTAARRLVSALAEVVLAVRPALATVSVEHPPTALPDPGDDDWWGLFGAGWADLERCDDRARQGFERLVADGRARRFGGGVWWSAGDRLVPDVDAPVSGRPDESLARDAYRAWTRGRAVDDGRPGTSAPVPEEGPLDASARPQLWFWSADGDPDALADRVRPWVADDGFVVATGGEDDPAWRPVTATAPAGAQASELLPVLRAVADEVGCSWAGLHPEGWLAVPGLDPRSPSTGIVPHVWVSRAWAGDLLDELDAAMPGAHREEVGAGVLWVTSPAFEADVDPSWSDHDTRFDRWTAAAAVLARAARRSRGEPVG